MDEASRILKAEYPNWPADELKSASNAMASRARGLRRANKALESNEALQQAFAEAKSNGLYEVTEGLFRNSTKLNREKLTRTPVVPKGSITSLPAGATQIGTKGGKPVYQTPDGKRFIGE